MDLKAMLFVIVAYSLLLTSRVSSNVEELSLLENFPLKASVEALVVPPPANYGSPLTPVAKNTPPPAAPSPVVSDPIAPPLPPPPPPVLSRPRNTKECFPLCRVRCTLHSRKNVCLRACVTCCDRCKCVPPGYYGQKEKCGKCYTNMTTRGGRSKCP